MPTLPPSSQPMASTVTSMHGADDPDRPAAASVQSGHQAVARAGAEAGADVEAGRDRDQEQAADEDGMPDPGTRLLRDEPEPELRARADQQHVQHGAEPGRCRIGIQSSSTTTPTRLVMSPKGSPVCCAMPCVSTSHGRDADAGADHERDPDAVEEEADEQLHDASGPDGAGPRRGESGLGGREATDAVMGQANREIGLLSRCQSARVATW